MQRMNWVDNLRGMSILAVIFLHCTFAVNGNVGHFYVASEAINDILMPVRLGLMFFVSGLFVEAGLKRGLKAFTSNKVKSILYPFVIWVGVYAGTKIVLSHHDQDVLSVLLPHLTGGGDITWFLHSLFVFFIIIIVARRMPFWLILSLCLAGSWLLPAVPADSVFASFDNSHFNKSSYLFIFFWLGDAVVRHKLDMPLLVKKPWVLYGSAAAFILLASLMLFVPALGQHAEEHFSWALMTPLAPLALASVPLFAFLAMRTHSRIIGYIGTHSIVFYLSHFMVIKLCARYFQAPSSSLWIDDGKYLFSFACALLLPWGICQLRNHGWLNFLFTLKKPAKRSLATS